MINSLGNIERPSGCDPWEENLESLLAVVKGYLCNLWKA